MSSDTCYIYSIYISVDECVLNVVVLYYYENSEIMLKIKAVRHCELINTCICSVCTGSNEINGLRYVQGKFHHSLGGKTAGNSCPAQQQHTCSFQYCTFRPPMSILLSTLMYLCRRRHGKQPGCTMDSKQASDTHF